MRPTQGRPSVTGSLDANSRYCAFGYKKERTEDAKQLFVLTHNFGFVGYSGDDCSDYSSWVGSNSASRGAPSDMSVIAISDNSNRTSVCLILDSGGTPSATDLFHTHAGAGQNCSALGEAAEVDPPSNI